MKSGETNIDILLQNMKPSVDSRVFVFCTLADRSAVTPALTDKAVMLFQEKEGVTLILEAADADLHDLPYVFPSHMITLNIHSALEAVGFLARIIPELARHGMGVNPVAGYFHDHLFIATEHTEAALKCLKDISGKVAH